MRFRKESLISSNTKARQLCYFILQNNRRRNRLPGTKELVHTTAIECLPCGVSKHVRVADLLHPSDFS